MSLTVQSFVAVLTFFALINPAFTKCLNGYQDILKFAGASNDCAGFFIGPDLYLTANHCLAYSRLRKELTIRVSPIGRTYEPNFHSWGTVLDVDT